MSFPVVHPHSDYGAVPWQPLCPNLDITYATYVGKMSHGPSALPLALLLLSLHVTPSILLPRRFPCIVPTRPKLYCPSLAKQRPLWLPKPPYLYAFFLLSWACRCSPNRSFSAFTNARASHNSFICFCLPTNPSGRTDELAKAVHLLVTAK